MTYGISKPLLSPAAINTSQIWEDLTQQPVHNIFVRDSRWQHTHSPSRRAKSHSPSRRSPKIKHTNGRLDEDPIAMMAALVSQNDTGGAPHSHDDKQQLFTRLHLTPIVPSANHGKKERGMSESEIPKRASLCRSITSVSQCAMQQQRSVSGVDASLSPTRRLKACYRDDALRERSAENTRRMIVIARQQSDPGSPQADSNATDNVSNNQQKLVLKALKYRNLLTRAKAIDESRLADPTFDVLEGLGVQWYRT